MADSPGNIRSGRTVSRHTMVMRKAKDDDARRLAEIEGEGAPPPEESAASSRRSRADGRASRGTRTISGRTVVVHREGEMTKRLSVSTRLAGDRATGVRVTGGDTIIRYESGDMVVKRSSRRIRIRKQLIWAYALGYLLLFGTYAYFLFTGTTNVQPMDFVNRVFARRHSSSIADLELAAHEAMRGLRTPAEVRVAQPISFYDENGDLIHVESGNRLTLVTAAKLGKAILDDAKKDAGKRSFNQPLVIYKETYIANLNWPHWLTVYNAVGFFLLILLFLWQPILNYLGTQAKKTAAAVRNAHDAQEEAQEYRNKYRRLAADIAEKDEAMRVATEAELEVERTAAVEYAKQQAAGIEGGIKTALEIEARQMAGRIGARAAAMACDRARVILEGRLGPAEHDLAIDELIADIGRMRLEPPAVG